MKDYIRQIAIKNKTNDISKIEDAINTAYVFLMFGNDTANNAMIDAKESIIQNGYYKKECKMYLNKAFGAYDKFETSLKEENIGTYANLLSCSDKLQDYISNDIYLLFMSFKNYLDKFNIKCSEMLSYIHVARVLLDRSVKAYYEYFRNVETNIGYDISPYLKLFKLDGVFKYWDNISCFLTQLVDNSDLVIDFNKDDKCRLAMKVVNDKLSDFTKLNDIIIEGLKDAENNNYNK